MREFFTVMLKENDTSNLKLLNDKLNEGFYVEDRIEVGRSTVVTLQRRVRENTTGAIRPVDTDSVYYSGSILASATSEGI